MKALLVSVGGTPNPVAYSIDHHQPDKLVFFVSPASRAEIETKIRPLATHRWIDQEIITTPDAQDLTVCMQSLSGELTGKLRLLDVTAEDLIVDYTGGTKSMSAAVVLATISQPVTYSYVGGQVRTKDGLGVVLDGSEAVLLKPNPWDVLALDLRRRMARHFNKARFGEARETADEAAAKVSERWRGFYNALSKLCHAYDRWQNFDYAAALGPLKAAFHKAAPYVSGIGDQGLSDFLQKVSDDLKRLETLLSTFKALQAGSASDIAGVRLLITDLVANSVRTARLAGRPDDGVARLYSALEKLGKAELMRLGIDNSRAKPEQIPDALRDEFTMRYLDKETGVLKFGLNASYEVLGALREPLGSRYQQRSTELEKLLGARNSSLFVHGWVPVKRDLFDKMLDIVLEFLDLDLEAMPKLPHLPEP